MRVLLISNLYPPYDRGGAEMVAKLNARSFKEAGHTVTILTSVPFQGLRSLVPKAIAESGLRIYRYYPLNFSFYGDLNNLPRWLRYIWAIIDIFNIHSWWVCRRVIKQENPDFVVSHNLRGLGYLLPRLISKTTSRYVHILHDVQLAEPSGILYPKQIESTLQSPLRKVYQTITRWFFSTVPIIVSPSRFLLEFYFSLGFFSSSRSLVLKNPISVSGNVPPEHQGVNVVYIGQMEEQKGVKVLLEAWPLVKEAEAKLHFVGSGPLLSAVSKKVEKNSGIIVYGRLEGANLEKVWEVADILVLPSLLIENSPIVISEALARGVMVVASDVGGVSELTKLSGESYLIPSGDVESLALALASAIRKSKKVKYITPIFTMSSRHYIEELVKLAGKN